MDHLVRRAATSPSVQRRRHTDKRATPFYCATCPVALAGQVCFVPGMLALGATELDRPKDLELAEQLASTCYRLYSESPTGIGPEIVTFGHDGKYSVNSGKYLLRPGKCVLENGPVHGKASPDVAWAHTARRFPQKRLSRSTCSTVRRATASTKTGAGPSSR